MSDGNVINAENGKLKVNVNETAITTAEGITPDCRRILPAGTEVIIMELGEIVKCASDFGVVYIDINKLKKA